MFAAGGHHRTLPQEERLPIILVTINLSAFNLIMDELARINEAIVDAKQRVTRQLLRIEQRRLQGRDLATAIRHLRMLEEALRSWQDYRQLLLDLPPHLLPYPLRDLP
jgi:hypothetical protein